VSESGFLAQLVHGDGPLALFEAYMDESGIHAGSRVCVVAGFVAPNHVCADLEIKWRTVLRKFGVKYFHAKEFAAIDSGQFFGWRAERKQRFISDALGTILDAFYVRTALKWPPLSIAVAIHADDFSALSLDERRWLTGGSLARSEKLKWKSPGAPTKP
jgi:hypothetical protein